jgi:hypothetical protein
LEVGRLAVDAFLGNPIMFYVHQDFFASGDGAFDRIADIVNQVQPRTKWASLGETARHLYRLKIRDDGDYDVSALSADLRLDNLSTKDVTFHVQKNEDYSYPIKSVTIDGRRISYERAMNNLLFVVPAAARSSKHVSITYEDGVNLRSTDISKSSVSVTLLRVLSDFRDRFLSTRRLGRVFVRFYYREIDSFNSVEIGLVLLAIFAAFLLIARCVRKRPRQAFLGFEPEIGRRMTASCRGRAGGRSSPDHK